MAEVRTRAATAAEVDQWQDLWQRRIEAMLAPWDQDARMEQRLRRRADAVDAPVLRLLVDGEPVGFLALCQGEDMGTPEARLDDVHVDEGHRRQGIGRAAVGLAEEWAHERGLPLSMSVNGGDPVHQALFAAYPVRAQRMIKSLTEVPALADGLVSRPMTDEEYQGWYAQEVDGYAESFVLNGLMTPEAAQAHSEKQFHELLPEGTRTEGQSIWTIADGDTAVGSIWLKHAYSPGTAWVFGVEVKESARGKGYGRAAMLAGEQRTIEGGDRRLALNVFGHNEVARRLYERLGYTTLDQSRSEDPLPA
ncbi:GNAT family N-acetyltransferase [Hamadaea tsunoensis]|uniref:GNAT family N-acetyltransferase n=1 Tax=Hamadaea tsunoensis TaxID=53368 RepID=UPI00146FAD27|nr:GNAT family N-acetyltransferase [Hamadaea tsunoensis]